MSAPIPLFSLVELEAAAELVHCTVPQTPQYSWPLLAKRVGCEVWVKHENHTPTCAFKVRGGLVYMDSLRRAQATVTGVISATRGNHGQSIAFAASQAGIPATIYVPRGNSADQNSAMRAFGAEVVEFGRDFDEALAECHRVARERDLHFIPPFNRDQVKGVATYALELFRAVPDLHTVYVPIGMGSGISGVITARDLLGLKTEVVGVVACNAPAMALSFAAGKPIPTNSAQTFADGLATRDPREEALAIIRRGAARVLQLSEDDIAAAVRAYFEDTHNVAEGAGAAALAGLMQERSKMNGRRVAVILSGGNIDGSVYQQILTGETPTVGSRRSPGVVDQNGAAPIAIGSSRRCAADDRNLMTSSRRVSDRGYPGVAPGCVPQPRHDMGCVSYCAAFRNRLRGDRRKESIDNGKQGRAAT